MTDIRWSSKQLASGHRYLLTDLMEGMTMWSFSYVGSGAKDKLTEIADAIRDQIDAAAENQVITTPERSHLYIRAAQEYVKQVAASTPHQVSIVAEGWVEEDGDAQTTIHVSVKGLKTADIAQPAPA